MWHEINSPEDVPNNLDVRLAVIDPNGTVHRLVFPCRRVGNSWIDAKFKRRVELNPTHWQEWAEGKARD
jgi:hypothetical protein